MPISQNARFSGYATPDGEFGHPAGASIARMLQTALQNTKWNVAEFDSWMDCGWSLDCSRGNTRLQIALSQMEEGQWMIQVAPTSNPDFIGRLFGGAVSAQPSATTDLAKSVHSILMASGSFRDFMWTWDGWPEGDNWEPEPQQPKPQQD
ncbi:MAG: hypothetical protein J0M04_03090 [Verrucomicrobia bacterium]|nr:hypothetical protein [Verrucomicrobiota bacterium]